MAKDIFVVHLNAHTLLTVVYTCLCTDSFRRVTRMTASGRNLRLIPVPKVTWAPGEQCRASTRTRCLIFSRRGEPTYCTGHVFSFSMAWLSGSICSVYWVWYLERIRNTYILLGDFIRGWIKLNVPGHFHQPARKRC